MTPDELRARCEQVHDQLMTFDLPVTHEASETLYLRNMAILKSLCREMMAEGLERAASQALVQHHHHKLNQWCRREAQRVKGGGE